LRERRRSLTFLVDLRLLISSSFRSNVHLPGALQARGSP
jgi:hypothetical protein